MLISNKAKIERRMNDEHCGSKEEEYGLDELSKKEQLLILSDTTKQIKGGKEMNLLNDNEIKRLLKADLQDYTMKLSKYVMKLEMEIAIGQKVDVKVEPKIKGDGNVKNTNKVKPNYTQEELDKMKQEAIDSGKSVVVGRKESALDIVGNVGASVVRVKCTNRGVWSSPKQAKYMKHKATFKNIPEGITVSKDEFVLVFINKEVGGKDYFLCNDKEIRIMYRATKNGLVAVWNKEDVGERIVTTYDNAAYELNDGRKVGVTAVEFEGLRKGEFVFVDGTRISYLWNPVKYAKSPAIKGAGKDTAILKALLISHFANLDPKIEEVDGVEETEEVPAFDESLYA